jgi:N-acetylmuramoyl-L-alanine amidase
MKKTLFISAGHGSIDPNDGKYTTKRDLNSKWFRHSNGHEYHNGSEFYEGESNRVIAAEFIAQATRRGYHCIPVYHEWKDTPLNVRTDFANETAKRFGYDSLYLSFHSNASNGNARGFVSFYHPTSANSKRLSEKVSEFASPYWSEYGSKFPNPVREGWMYNSDGTKRGIYHENLATNMPALIIENGFFDNPFDADLLMNHEFAVGLCSAILDGLDRY